MTKTSQGTTSPYSSLQSKTISPYTIESQLLRKTSIHDLLALGEIKAALQYSHQDSDSTQGATKSSSILENENQDDKEKSDNTINKETAKRKRHEVDRLPLLLRLLSSSQNLATIPSITLDKTDNDLGDNEAGNETHDEEEKHNVASEAKSSTAVNYCTADEIVPLLERVAASHPEAEGVDLLTTRLAPNACKEISKLPPLSRKKHMIIQNNGNNKDFSFKITEKWSTEGLRSLLQVHSVADDKNFMSMKRSVQPPSVNPNKRKNNVKDDLEEKTSSKRTKGISSTSENVTGIFGDDMDYTEVNEASVVTTKGSNIPEDKKISKQQSPEKKKDYTQFGRGNIFFDIDADDIEGRTLEDSQESGVKKVLDEFVALISSSLEPIVYKTTKEGEDGNGNNEDDDKINSTVGKNSIGEKLEDDNTITTMERNSTRQEDVNSNLILPIKSDSLLAEPPVSKEAPVMSNLSATLPALMHHAPILRHAHVAGALCRAMVSQAPDAIGRMAANCPSASQCLIRGCIDAFITAQTFRPNVDMSEKSVNVCDKISYPHAHNGVQNISISCVKEIANLSKREACNVISALERARVMPDVALELLIIISDSSEDDIQEDGAVIAILDDLSSNIHAKKEQKHDSVIAEETSKGKISHLSHTKGSLSLSKHDNSRWIYHALCQNSVLAGKTREHIVNRMMSLTHLLDTKRSYTSNEKACKWHLPWGRGTLLLRSYALLIHHVGIGAGSSSRSGSTYVESAMKALLSLLEKISDILGVHTTEKIYQDIKDCDEANSISNKDRLAMSSQGDEFLATAIVACITTCANFPPIADSSSQIFVKSPSSKACFQCLSKLLSMNLSIMSSVFNSRIAGFLLHNEPLELQNTILSHLLNNELFSCADRYYCNLHEERYTEIDKFHNICQWAMSMLDTSKLEEINLCKISIESMVTNAALLLDLIKRGESIDETFTSIISIPSRCSCLYKQKETCAILLAMITNLQKKKDLIIPLVLPITLESLSRRLFSLETISDNSLDPKYETKDLWCQFILHLLYAMIFLDLFPDSPFIINIRCFPMKEILSSNLWISEECHQDNIRNQLLILASRHCPDSVPHDFKMRQNIDIRFVESHHYLHLNQSSNKQSPMIVEGIIRELVQKEIPNDFSENLVENIFLSSRTFYPSLEVDTAAIKAMLSKSHSPPLYLTYNELCNDPLILFKCKLSIWKCMGLRRIILTILKELLDANEILVKRKSRSLQVASELLSARDALVLKCLISLGSGSYLENYHIEQDGKAISCNMLVSLVRILVTKRKGIIAFLIKQGLNQISIDWIVEFVPESFNDANIFISYLSDKKKLNVVERLSIADATLRIAIGRGHQNDKISEHLAYAALSVLVSSFFLVLGPVGVPVNLLCERNGRDITQMSRMITFRMLQALQTISGKKIGLKNEARLALSKIAGLCKSESTNVNGLNAVTAMKRKSLLKEIWDQVLRAINVVGGVQF